MRIRDYIRDDLRMGRKRENKSGQHDADVSRGLCPRCIWRQNLKCPAAIAACSRQKNRAPRAMRSTFLSPRPLTTIDFRYTKPHVT